MSTINSKLPQVGTTIFTIMSQMAKDYDAINLSQGFPNFPVDPALIDLYKEVLNGESHQYRPMSGAPNLLEAIAQKIKEQYRRKINTGEELLVTAGATQAIYTAIQALVMPGEKVIILDPSYDCYAPAVIMAGGQPVHLNMEADFSIDWNKVADHIDSKTKMLIFNNPHNPGGKAYTEKDLEALEQIMEQHQQLILLSDEVYEYIYYEQKHLSVNTREKIRDRSLIVSSFGKTFHITGWKIGYLVAPSAFMKEIKKVHQFLVFCVNSTAQETLARYLPSQNLNQLSAFYRSKRDLFRKLMQGSRFDLLPCEGSYFQVAGYGQISNKSDVAFVQELTQKHGVAAIPISGFNQDGHDDHLIRFCFAKTDDTLIQATKELCKI